MTSPDLHPIPLNAVKAWLFDLDGTLMDTDDQSVATLASKLSFLGETRSRAVARRAVMFSETPLNSIAAAIDMIGLDPLAFAVRRILRGGRPYTFPIIPGVEALLHYLAGQGMPLAVVSTRSRAAAEAFLSQYHLTDLFWVLVTQESTRRLKPHPEPVQYAAQALGVAPEACAMVGDTVVDVRAARRAGAWSVAVLCGFGEEPELRRAGAHWILPGTADLLTQLHMHLEP